MKALVEYALAKLGEPETVEYVWNGQNQYVFCWLERHVSPVCKCPMAVQKPQPEDDWDSHVYTLDKGDFLGMMGREKVNGHEMDSGKELY